jgi:hypothetical protein
VSLILEPGCFYNLSKFGFAFLNSCYLIYAIYGGYSIIQLIHNLSVFKLLSSIFLKIAYILLGFDLSLM